MSTERVDAYAEALLGIARAEGDPDLVHDQRAQQRAQDDAGAVQFGVLNMAEFAFGPTGHNYHYGHCRNAWDPSRITGGSSSGSGSSGPPSSQPGGGDSDLRMWDSLTT